jgi:hypothetical protein
MHCGRSRYYERLCYVHLAASGCRQPHALPVVGAGAADGRLWPSPARQLAAQLFPGISGELTRKRDAGRADAILIARSGLMTLRPAQSQVAQ